MNVPAISKPVLWFFRRIVRRYFRRHFSGVRLSGDPNLASLSDERLIVYANHSSWWDPMVLVLLAAKMEGGCTVLPLAIEYVFWDERLPETLLHFGDPVRVDGQSVDEVQELLEAALLKAMETLKAEAMSRNPAGFSLLHVGTVGTGGFYELGQRMIAALRRRRFQPEHTAVVVPPPIPNRVPSREGHG